MRSIFFSTFWLSVAFFVWTVRQTFAAPMLSGPESIQTCESITFSWSNASVPVTFYVNNNMVAIMNTSSYTLLAPALAGGTAVQFFVIDANNERSNILQYAIQSGTTTCAVPTYSTASDSYSIPVPASSASTTYRSSSFSGTATTVASTSTPAPTFSAVVTVSHAGTTSTGFAPGVNNASSTSRNVMVSSVVIIISVLSFVVGLVLVALCCWIRHRVRRRRALEGDPQNEKRFDWLVPGVKRVKAGSKNRSKPLLTEGDQEERLNAEPNTPWETSSELPSASVERLPAAHPAHPPVHVLPSSKELRMRAAQGMYSGRDLEAGTSMSEMSGPVSTVHSTSIWPSVSESDEGHANASEPRVARGDRRRDDPRSLQAIIQRELQQILHNNQLNTDSSQTTPQQQPSLPTTSSTDLPNSHIDTLDDEPSNPFGDQKAPLRLDIPSGANSRDDLIRSATLASALESSAQGRTPISRRDMELLADLVAERLGRRRESAAPGELNHLDAPPPSYS
ncbi:hypothetical protein CPB86DRAFT_822677 [Serendipita vermifera]|nr:hypothetical protein CPB86DRAFT_822677 [Serendipita vermifera]